MVGFVVAGAAKQAMRAANRNVIVMRIRVNELHGVEPQLDKISHELKNKAPTRYHGPPW
jgi:hypothetical protein